MSMKSDFDAILKKYGRNIKFQRLLNAKVDNEAPKYNTTKFEIWTTYSQVPRASSSLTSTAQEQEEGNINNVDQIFYFQAELNPTEGDRIYDYVDRFPGNQATYLIDYASPMQVSGNNIVFWEVGASRETPE